MPLSVWVSGERTQMPMQKGQAERVIQKAGKVKKQKKQVGSPNRAEVHKMTIQKTESKNQA